LSDSHSLGQCPVPKIFIVSTHDQFCARQAMETYFAALLEPKELIWVDATDHFFTDALDQFEEAVYGVTQTTNFSS